MTAGVAVDIEGGPDEDPRDGPRRRRAPRGRAPGEDPRNGARARRVSRERAPDDVPSDGARRRRVSPELAPDDGPRPSDPAGGGGPRSHRGGGPFDEDDLDPERPDGVARTDFGALRLLVPSGGVVDVEPSEKGKLQAVHLTVPEGRLSISALAAPTTGRLWPELAKEINASLRAGGARVRSFQGRWGRELRARTGEAFSVFVGVDGPRWMLYGVATGPAQQARLLDRRLRQVLGETVVVRGRSPYPVRTVLPLVLPEAMQAEREARLEREQTAAAALEAREAERLVAETAAAEQVAQDAAGPAALRAAGPVPPARRAPAAPLWRPATPAAGPGRDGGRPPVRRPVEPAAAETSLIPIVRHPVAASPTTVLPVVTSVAQDGRAEFEQPDTPADDGGPATAFGWPGEEKLGGSSNGRRAPLDAGGPAGPAWRPEDVKPGTGGRRRAEDRLVRGPDDWFAKARAVDDGAAEVRSSSTARRQPGDEATAGRRSRRADRHHGDHAAGMTSTRHGGGGGGQHAAEVTSTRHGAASSGESATEPLAVVPPDGSAQAGEASAPGRYAAPAPAYLDDAMSSAVAAPPGRHRRPE
jgi:hypothetical protein